MTKLDWLADEFRDAGLDVVEHEGWKTRTGQPFSKYTPVGLLDHHTAGTSVLTNYPGPPYYPNTSLEMKCNYTIRGNGVVVVLNAGWAYDSGYGDRKVLEAVKADKRAPAPTDTYNAAGNPAGSNPGLLMNRWYIDVEVQHLGFGQPIAAAQREALIISNRVVCEHMGWDPAFRLLGHRESTKRKTDPRWDGFVNPMPGIRLDTIGTGDEDMTSEEREWMEAQFDDIRAAVGRVDTEVWAHGHKTDPATGAELVPSMKNYVTRSYSGIVALLREDLATDEDIQQAADEIIAAVPPATAKMLGKLLVAGNQE